VDTGSRALGLHFMNVRDLRGRPCLDAGGERLGTVAAVVTRVDGAVDVLVLEDRPRGRVHRLTLDDVEIDEQGNLWRCSPWRAYRAVAPATADSLIER